MDTKRIQETINAYLSDLRKVIPVDRAILFGSAARGPLRDDSDIDLLILSKSFTPMTIDQRFDMLYTARKRLLTQQIPMDLFPLTPQEFDDAPAGSILAEIKGTGKNILLK